ncbi:hypothetical protein KP509_30G036600 [Ceratopteris richardii]|uniref:Uncharacterized protein n=1 Tax=Ceratopteris richardii TaxID=49495 RepID=A0A8T2R3X5_CERRI|nr:hypothetical protein KP509_30G036600 [Ceratopteris richardii]
MASRASLLKCIAATCSRSACRRPGNGASSLGALRNSPDSFSSRISRFRGAITGLHSLQPLHSTVAESLFVSKLSFGTSNSLFVQDGDDDGT